MICSFLLEYVGIPIIIGVGHFYSKKNNNKRSKCTTVAIKGIFYFYLAITSLIAYLKGSNGELQSAIAGLTISLAILEGTFAITDCMSQNDTLPERTKK